MLMNLAEAPSRSLRMSDLANRGGLSPCRISRLVDGLVADGPVTRAWTESDGRVQNAGLTKPGTARLQAVHPAHLPSVRRNVVDHLGYLDLHALAPAAAAFAPDCRPLVDSEAEPDAVSAGAARR